MSPKEKAAKETTKKEEDTLTRLELQIMQVLWRNGPGNVANVQQALEQPLAYTTVQTMLNILHRKGKLQRTLDGRAFVYRPTVTRDRALSHAVRDLVDRMFGGSSEELVMSLIQSRQIDPERIARLTRQIDETAQATSEPEEEKIPETGTGAGKRTRSGKGGRA